MPEHTADRPNWALAPEVTADSNDSASIAPDEMDVDATPGVCFPDLRRANVSVRAAVGSTASILNFPSSREINGDFCEVLPVEGLT